MKVLLLLMLFLPNFAFAQTIVVNEIAWMGVPVEGVDSKQWWRYEFLELFNSGEQPVSLQGWKIELYSGSILDFAILLHGSVGAQEYFLVGASDKIVGVDVHYATLNGKLKNSGQRIVLKDVVGGVVEQIDAQESWFAGDNDVKLTMERRFLDRSANDRENWGSSKNTGGSPKAQNSLFGKEAFLKLDSVQQKQNLTKKDSLWSSFVQTITNAVFIRAFLVAVLSAAAVLALRRYLIGSLGQAP